LQTALGVTLDELIECDVGNSGDELEECEAFAIALGSKVSGHRLDEVAAGSMTEARRYSLFRAPLYHRSKNGAFWMQSAKHFDFASDPL
jgi:hypothetical protein